MIVYIIMKSVRVCVCVNVCVCVRVRVCVCVPVCVWCPPRLPQSIYGRFWTLHLHPRRHHWFQYRLGGSALTPLFGLFFVCLVCVFPSHSLSRTNSLFISLFRARILFSSSLSPLLLRAPCCSLSFFIEQLQRSGLASTTDGERGRGGEETGRCREKFVGVWLIKLVFFS